MATGKELRQRPLSLSGLPPAAGRPRESPPYKEVIHAVEFSPDGKTVAVAAQPALYFVDVATGQDFVKSQGYQGPTRVAFSPDGKMLVSGGWDKTVRLLEAATGKELLKIAGLEHVNAVAFAPDGRSVAAATGWTEGILHLFDVATGKELLRFQGHGAYVGALAFAPDGKTLASGQRDTTILVWDLAAAGRGGLPARDLGTQELDALWADLAGEEGPKVHRAVWTLIAASKTVVPFLKERLRPAEPTDLKHIRQLLADLDSQQFAAREAASKELTSLGVEAEPALREALKGSPSAEFRRCVEALLAGLASRRVPSPEVLRRLRALQVLEQIGSTEVRSILETLARGAPAAVETREADAARERLT